MFPALEYNQVFKNDFIANAANSLAWLETYPTIKMFPFLGPKKALSLNSNLVVLSRKGLYPF